MRKVRRYRAKSVPLKETEMEGMEETEKREKTEKTEKAMKKEIEGKETNAKPLAR